MEQPNILVSFDDVKLKDFRAYWEAVRRGDYKGQDKFFAQVIKSWDHTLDPTDPFSYGELDLVEYFVVQTAIKQKSAEISKSLRK